MKLPGKKLNTRTGKALSIGYIAQAYSAIVSLAFAPYILSKIGAEAYGLVGIFLIAQGWIQLLDAGLTPTTTRETARYRGNAVSGQSLANTLKGLETVIFIVAVPLMLLAWSLSDNIANDWLTRKTLSASEVSIAVNIMILIFTIRWASGLRRGILLGSEKHTLIYLINLGVATLRYPLIVVFFYLVEPSSTHYFLYQLGISCFEALLLWTLTRPLVPRHLANNTLVAVKSLNAIKSFAFNHSYLALIWVLITQADKIFLSKTISLDQYGYFTLAIAAAAGVRLIAQPIGQLLKPRLARLYAQSDHKQLVQTFRIGTRFAVVTLSGLTATFLFFGHDIMLAWTGDHTIAAYTGTVLAFYALGNSIMLMGTFTYYLQFASGDLRLHRTGSTLILLIIVPVMYYAAHTYGIVGTAKAWARHLADVPVFVDYLV